jgi:hypothetical protein
MVSGGNRGGDIAMVLAGWLGWFRDPDGYAALALGVSVTVSVLLADVLRALVIAPELRALLGVSRNTNAPDDDPVR